MCLKVFIHANKKNGKKKENKDGKKKGSMCWCLAITEAKYKRVTKYKQAVETCLQRTKNKTKSRQLNFIYQKKILRRNLTKTKLLVTINQADLIKF